MRVAAQAPALNAAKAWHRRAVAGAALVSLSIIAAGCGAGGAVLGQAETDPSIVSSISPQTAASGDAQRLSDEATIRNAVSSADVKQATGDPINWANADTGSRGAINSLVESKDGNQLCRQFTTTRESFEGIALYRGKACLVQPGAWQMQGFSAL